MPPSILPPRRSLAAVVALLVATGAAAGADELGNRAVSGRAPQGVLDLPDGFLQGTLVPAPAEADGPRRTLRWRAEEFTAPFEFHLDEIAGVRFAEPPPSPAAADAVRVHLRGADAIDGVIEAIDATTLTLRGGATVGGASLRIDRRLIENLARPGRGAGSYSGPGGIIGWSLQPPAAWREEAGRLVASQRGSTLARDIPAPPRARYDIELSWEKPAEFRLSFAAGKGPLEDRFWVELLRGGDAADAATGRLLVVRREGVAATLQPVSGFNSPAGAGRLRLVAFVDQPRGRLAVVLPGAADKPAAVDVRLPPAALARAGGEFRIAVTGGDLCLESIRVTPWLAEEPSLDDAASLVITTTDDVIRDATLESFDPQADAFVVTVGGQSGRLARADVEEISFPAAVDAEDQKGEQPALWVVTAAGERISGDLVKVDDDAVWVQRAGIAEPVAVAIAQLVVIRPLQVAERPRPVEGRLGRLEHGRFALPGALVPGTGDDAVHWWPQGSANGSGFAAAGAAGFSATLEYVRQADAAADAATAVGGIGGMVNADPDGQFVVTMLAEDGAAARDGRLEPGDRIVSVAPTEGGQFVATRGLDQETVTDLLRGPVGSLVRLRVSDEAGENPREIDLRRGQLGVVGDEVLRKALETHLRLAAAPLPAEAREHFPATVILRDGERIRCAVEDVGPDGVTLRTPFGPEESSVSNAFIQAVELDSGATSRPLDAARFERLVTVPRMQRDRPPTHLLRLRSGDYLRGRLVGLDAETARLELQGVERSLARAQVARIIWLHPADAPLPTPVAAKGLAAQAQASGNQRLSFAVTGFDGEVLAGTSAALGPVSVDVAAVDRILFGAAAEEVPPSRPYEKWRPRPAPEPRVLRERPGAPAAE